MVIVIVETNADPVVVEKIRTQLSIKRLHAASANNVQQHSTDIQNGELKIVMDELSIPNIKIDNAEYVLKKRIKQLRKSDKHYDRVELAGLEKQLRSLK